jgi:hypothetical protein
MAAGDAVASPYQNKPRIYSIGPFWPGLVISAIVAGAMLPWIHAEHAVEISIPWMEVWRLPQGMPLWVLIAAGVGAFLSSIRSRVSIDEQNRTVTNWRCIGIFVPWSKETRPFEEVRAVWLGVYGGLTSISAGELLTESENDGTQPTPSNALSVHLVFHDRCRFVVGQGSDNRMLALCEELCTLFGVRRI